VLTTVLSVLGIVLALYVLAAAGCWIRVRTAAHVLARRDVDDPLTPLCPRHRVVREELDAVDVDALRAVITPMAWRIPASHLWIILRHGRGYAGHYRSRWFTGRQRLRACVGCPPFEPASPLAEPSPPTPVAAAAGPHDEQAGPE
jgi:hypothetical protein